MCSRHQPENGADSDPAVWEDLYRRLADSLLEAVLEPEEVSDAKA